MKISFNGTYKEVSRLVNSPLRSNETQEGGSRFVRLLSSMLPQANQAPEIKGQSTQNLTSLLNKALSDGDPMASIKFDPPGLSPPLLEPVSNSSAQDLQVNDSPQGVKTPTLLEVRKFIGPVAKSSAPGQDQVAAIKNLVTEAGRRHGVDPTLGMAVAAAESSFDTNAVSSDGFMSKGLFQLLDSTGKQLHQRFGYDGHYDPHNPKLNVDLGVGYLRYLHDIFSVGTELPNNANTVAAANSASLEKLSLAAFNAGEGRVASAQERAKRAGGNPAEYNDVVDYLPESTIKYVDRVLAFRSEFERGFIG